MPAFDPPHQSNPEPEGPSPEKRALALGCHLKNYPNLRKTMQSDQHEPLGAGFALFNVRRIFSGSFPVGLQSSALGFARLFLAAFHRELTTIDPELHFDDFNRNLDIKAEDWTHFGLRGFYWRNIRPDVSVDAYTRFTDVIAQAHSYLLADFYLLGDLPDRSRQITSALERARKLLDLPLCDYSPAETLVDAVATYKRSTKDLVLPSVNQLSLFESRALQDMKDSLGSSGW